MKRVVPALVVLLVLTPAVSGTTHYEDVIIREGPYRAATLGPGNERSDWRISIVAPDAPHDIHVIPTVTIYSDVTDGFDQNAFLVINITWSADGEIIVARDIYHQLTPSFIERELPYRPQLPAGELAGKELTLRLRTTIEHEDSLDPWAAHVDARRLGVRLLEEDSAEAPAVSLAAGALLVLTLAVGTRLESRWRLR